MKLQICLVACSLLALGQSAYSQSEAIPKPKLVKTAQSLTVRYGDTGKPAAGMQVHYRIAENGTDDRWTTVATDEKGQCTFSLVSVVDGNSAAAPESVSINAPEFQVEIEDPKNIYATSAGMSFGITQKLATLQGADYSQKSLDNIVMETGTFVAGIVTDRETGAPLAGVRLMLQAANNPYGPDPSQAIPAFTVLTDARGRYRFAVVPGKYQILLADKEPPKGYVAFDEDAPYVLAEGSVAKGATANAPVQLTPFRAAMGIVVDAMGKPIAGVAVSLASTDPQEIEAQQDTDLNYLPNGLSRADEQVWLEDQRTLAAVPVSDATGYWESKPLRPNAADGSGRYRIVVTPGWEVVSPREIVLPPIGAKVTPFSIVVRPSGEKLITGEVKTPEGLPLAGVVLDVNETRSTGAHSNMSEGHGAITDSVGRYYIRNADDAALILVQIDAKCAVRCVSEHSADFFRPAPNTPSQIPAIIARRLGGTLAGQVVDARNRTIAGALVWSSDGDLQSLTQTDATGHFSLANLTEGAVSLHAVFGMARLDSAITTSAPGAPRAVPPILTLSARPPLTEADFARAREGCIDSLMESVRGNVFYAGRIRHALVRYAPERVLSAKTRFGYDYDGSLTRTDALLELVRRDPTDATRVQRCLGAIGKFLQSYDRANYSARLGCRIYRTQPALAAQLYESACAESKGRTRASEVGTEVALFELAIALKRTAEIPGYTTFFQTTYKEFASRYLSEATEDQNPADVPVVDALTHGMPAAQRIEYYRQFAADCGKAHAETADAYRRAMALLPPSDVGRANFLPEYQRLALQAERELSMSPAKAQVIWKQARAAFFTPDPYVENRYYDSGSFLWQTADLDPGFTQAVAEMGFHWSANRGMDIQRVTSIASKYAVVLGKIDPERALTLLDDLTRQVAASKTPYAIDDVIFARIALLHFFSLSLNERQKMDFATLLNVRQN